MKYDFPLKRLSRVPLETVVTSLCVHVYRRRLLFVCCTLGPSVDLRSFWRSSNLSIVFPSEAGRLSAPSCLSPLSKHFSTAGLLQASKANGNYFTDSGGERCRLAVPLPGRVLSGLLGFSRQHFDTEIKALSCQCPQALRISWTTASKSPTPTRRTETPTGWETPVTAVQTLPTPTR